MNVEDLLSLFRNMADDEATPYFWPDDVFYIYLTDAINKYCEKGKAIRDHTSSLTLIEYTANSPWVKLDEKVIKLISAYDVGTKTKLHILDWDTFSNTGGGSTGSDYTTLLSVSRYPDAVGSVYSIITGMEEDKLRLVNIPTVSGALTLIIERYPLYPISESNLKIEGVPDADRISLLDWVMFRSYAHQDAEIFDPDKSIIARTSFLEEMKEVDSRDMKKNHRPNAITGYGGI